MVLRIGDIAFGGEGVARVEDFVVFVPFVHVGELVEAQITEAKKRFCRARLLRVMEASPERVEPLCRYFGFCGGCQYQHIAYPAQLRLKQKQIADLFERIGGFDPRLVAPVVPCPEPYGYRNRIMIRSQWDRTKQGLNIGFIRADSRLVADIEECRIAEPALNQEIQRVRAHPPPKGGLKVVLRIPPDDWEVPPDSFFQNNFFLAPKLVEVAREFLREGGARFLIDLYCGVGFFSLELSDQVEQFVGVELDQMAIKAARRNAIARNRNNGQFIAGAAEEVLPALLGGDPPSLRFGAVSKSERRTPFRRELVASPEWGTADKVEDEVGDKVSRAEARRLDPLGGDKVKDKVEGRFDPGVTSVLLDPPRKGCVPGMLELLRRVRPAQIIYVSCHPATMARDLNVLCAQGVFELARVVPLDMFPQTSHVESVADIRVKPAC